MRNGKMVSIVTRIVDWCALFRALYVDHRKATSTAVHLMSVRGYCIQIACIAWPLNMVYLFTNHPLHYTALHHRDTGLVSPVTPIHHAPLPPAPRPQAPAITSVCPRGTSARSRPPGL